MKTIDFSKYKIHIPVEKVCGRLLAEGREVSYKQNEIYSYDEGIKIILKENRGLWLPARMLKQENVVKHFEELGIETG